MKQEIHSLLPVGRPVLSHLHGSITCNHDLWKQTSSLGMSLPLIPPGWYAEYGIVCCGTRLWPVEISCPGCVPSQLFLHPKPPHDPGGTVWGMEKALTLCKHYSAVIKTSLNYQHFFQTNPNAIFFYNEKNLHYPSQNQYIDWRNFSSAKVNRLTDVIQYWW